MGRPKKQFCIHEHDTWICGRNKSGHCAQCGRERGRKDPTKDSRKTQFCPNSHDTSLIGRNTNNTCNECVNISNLTVRKRNIKLINEAKDKPCMDCGIKYPSYVMDFDHRDRNSKIASISDMKYFSTNRLIAEIAKCDVVCSNCHRIRTFKYN